MIRYLLVWVLVTAACAAVAHPQLSGTYTCANGNPGNAFDYGDIGDFFSDLEAFGVAGPVTLDIYDAGGPFVSNDSYSLGAEYLGHQLGVVPKPVAGLGPTNTLTIRAAPGDFPEIVGFGTGSGYGFGGAIALRDVSFVTIQGLTIHNGDNPGISVLEVAPASVQHITIARCRIFNRRKSGLEFAAWGSGKIDNVTIENNLLWDCGLTHIIDARASGIEWVVRHKSLFNNAPVCGRGLSMRLAWLPTTLPTSRTSNGCLSNLS